MDYNEIQQKPRTVSHNFKMVVVTLLFFLILMRLVFLVWFPDTSIISDKVLLSILLFIVLYLWVQERKDYANLLELYKDLRKTHEQLKQAEIDTIASLVKTEEEKDPYTRGHSERVTEIALAIADEMNLDKKAKKTITRAGILHDIGKIGISNEILNKKEKLTNFEWSVIKRHPEVSARILEPLRFLAVEREVILQHHERYDGTGYPHGLMGDKIRTEALILGVADSFDAMCSTRAYRNKLTKDQVVSEFEKARDTQHSSKIIDALFDMLEKKPELWRTK